MDPLEDFTLGDFPFVVGGSSGDTEVSVTQGNVQVLAERLIAAVAKINELVTAVTDLTTRVETLEAPPE